MIGSGWADPYNTRYIDFDVTTRDFADLEIRGEGTFHYFYDIRNQRMVADFLLDDRPLVATLCTVTIIRADGAFSPRIKLWKRDKRKAHKEVLIETIPGTESSQLIKAQVDTSDVNESFWRVINFVQGCLGLDTPGSELRPTALAQSQLTELLASQDRNTLLESLRTAISGTLTEDDISLISNRKLQLSRFNRLLVDPEYFAEEAKRKPRTGPEAVWQSFFEENPWIFGYGLKLIACEPLDDGKLEQITTGAGVFTGAGKRSDAVMRSRGFIGSLLFCEIKTHLTSLLEKQPYRPPDVYQASREIVGGVAQVQKTAGKALRLLHDQLDRLYGANGDPSDIELSTTRPRQVLVIGRLTEFGRPGSVNRERIASFEHYRRSIQDIEVITFDELYERTRFIVEDR